MNLSPVTPTTFSSLVFHRNTELSSVDAQIQDLFRFLKVNKDSREVTIHKLPPFLPLDVFKNIISKIPQNLKSLRIISSHLNDLHLELLAKENWIRKLTHLDLSDNLITFEGIYRLQDELPEIHHLSLKKTF
jgi:hypothetical protein